MRCLAAVFLVAMVATGCGPAPPADKGAAGKKAQGATPGTPTPILKSDEADSKVPTLLQSGGIQVPEPLPALGSALAKVRETSPKLLATLEDAGGLRVARGQLPQSYGDLGQPHYNLWFLACNEQLIAVDLIVAPGQLPKVSTGLQSDQLGVSLSLATLMEGLWPKSVAGKDVLKPHRIDSSRRLKASLLSNIDSRGVILRFTGYTPAAQLFGKSGLLEGVLGMTVDAARARLGALNSGTCTAADKKAGAQLKPAKLKSDQSWFGKDPLLAAVSPMELKLAGLTTSLALSMDFNSLRGPFPNTPQTLLIPGLLGQAAPLVVSLRLGNQGRINLAAVSVTKPYGGLGANPVAALTRAVEARFGAKKEVTARQLPSVGYAPAKPPMALYVDPKEQVRALSVVKNRQQIVALSKFTTAERQLGRTPPAVERPSPLLGVTLEALRKVYGKDLVVNAEETLAFAPIAPLSGEFQTGPKKLEMTLKKGVVIEYFVIFNDGLGLNVGAEVKAALAKRCGEPKVKRKKGLAHLKYCSMPTHTLIHNSSRGLWILQTAAK